jgi:methionyl-tRNA formyltransferase
MKKLRIGYFADGPWSHQAFEKIIQDSRIEIAFIVPRSDTTDQTLKEYSKKYRIDYLTPVKINSEEFFQMAQAYACDLFVSMSFNQIFKNRIINLPPLKTINCHAGALPYYRGRNILNWALINDEKEFGITVHYIDEGIDTGDIILQDKYKITDLDDYSTLLKRAYSGCADILYRSLDLFLKDAVVAKKQSDIHPVGFYCTARGDGDEVLDWNQTSREVFNFVRAICKPGPMARSWIRGGEIKINKVIEVPGACNYKNTIGAVVGMTENGFMVKTSDSLVEVVDWEYDSIVRVGDRLRNSN